MSTSISISLFSSFLSPRPSPFSLLFFPSLYFLTLCSLSTLVYLPLFHFLSSLLSPFLSSSLSLPLFFFAVFFSTYAPFFFPSQRYSPLPSTSLSCYLHCSFTSPPSLSISPLSLPLPFVLASFSLKFPSLISFLFSPSPFFSQLSFPHFPLLSSSSPFFSTFPLDLPILSSSPSPNSVCSPFAYAPISLPFQPSSPCIPTLFSPPFHSPPTV